MNQPSNIVDMEAVFSPKKAESSSNIVLIPPEQISFMWKKVREQLRPAVKRSQGRWTLEHLLVSLVTGQQHLWVVWDEAGESKGCVTTQIVNYPNSQMLAFQFLGGEDFDGWYPDMLKILEAFALDGGCDGVEGTARFGFWKWLEKDGFDKSYAVYEKVLNNV